MAQNLTKRELEVLRYIEDYTKTYQEAPRFRDIQYHFGFSSLGTVHSYISNLTKKGALQKEKQKRRSMSIIQAPEAPAPFSKEIRVPFVGYIAAGFPIETFPQPKEITVPSIWVQSMHSTYALRAIGNSLMDELIADGDFLVVEARQEAEEGETVIALLHEHETVVRRYFIENSMIRLDSCSHQQDPILVQPYDIKIQGALVGLLRLF